jgi:hypothetical protein
MVRPGVGVPAARRRVRGSGYVLGGPDWEFEVQGSGFRVKGLELWVEGVGCRV